MSKRPIPEPMERQSTIRQAILEELRRGCATSKDLSALVRISEKEVAPHLEHLARSLRRGTERLKVDPARCLACGYVFEDRTRYTRPSACPACRSQRIEPPVFSVTGKQTEP